MTKLVLSSKNRNFCRQSYYTHSITSRKGKHRSQDESNDVEELVFETDFLGEGSCTRRRVGGLS